MSKDKERDKKTKTTVMIPFEDDRYIEFTRYDDEDTVLITAICFNNEIRIGDLVTALMKVAVKAAVKRKPIHDLFDDEDDLPY